MKAAFASLLRRDFVWMAMKRTTCFDGDEGLELCLVENYDLILLDLNLPGVDGLESCASFGNPILPLPF